MSDEELDGAYREHGDPMSAIARVLELHPSTISRRVGRVAPGRRPVRIVRQGVERTL